MGQRSTLNTGKSGMKVPPPVANAKNSSNNRGKNNTTISNNSNNNNGTNNFDNANNNKKGDNNNNNNGNITNSEKHCNSSNNNNNSNSINKNPTNPAIHISIKSNSSAIKNSTINNTDVSMNATPAAASTSTSALHSSSPPLGDPHLDGVTNIFIPVSTLELMFQRFDMLEKQLDDLKLIENRSSAVHSKLAHEDVDVAEKAELAKRISVLEETIQRQNTMLEEINNKSLLLLEENNILKTNLDNALSGLKSLQCAQRKVILENSDSSVRMSSDGISTCTGNNTRPISWLSHGAVPAGPGVGSPEACELIINGILKKEVELTSETTKSIAFAVLRTVLPTLTKDNVLGARVLQPRDSAKRPGETDTRKGLRSGPGALPSCIVRLNSPSLVKEIMRARRSLANNYLRTSDVSRELLSPESAACMPNQKIFLNEMLSHDMFIRFKSLKAIAQGLGFKYVWHSGGRFLARRKGGERAHAFTSAADLQAIQTACQSVPKQMPSNSGSVLNNISENRQGTEQTAGMAQPT